MCTLTLYEQQARTVTRRNDKKDGAGKLIKKKRDYFKHKQRDLVSMVSDATGFTKGDCKIVLDAIPDCVMKIMKETNDAEDTEISLASGIVLGSRYIPEKELVDPRNREPITVPAKLQPYGKFTDRFKELVNEDWEG